MVTAALAQCRRSVKETRCSYPSARYLKRVFRAKAKVANDIKSLTTAQKPKVHATVSLEFDVKDRPVRSAVFHFSPNTNFQALFVCLFLARYFYTITFEGPSPNRLRFLWCIHCN